ncbi:MAG: tRNA pseudouridine(38-40) synthase TruA [Actinomycetota bacterium]|nr:tRNA pseudouridine(38-40) synthase TruA [Actinomycetota bacterium]
MTLFGAEPPLGASDRSGDARGISGPRRAGGDVRAADPGSGLALPRPPVATVRLRLDIAYDGSGFRGFAAQPGQRTVAGVLVEAIGTVVRHSVSVTCAGRTDAGVHAQGQVVHVDVTEDVDLARLARSVNALTGPDVVIRHAQVAAPGFDARRCALGRHYRYLVHHAETADPLLARVAWTVAGQLDLRAMAAGADVLVGEHDFRSLCRRPPGAGPDDPIVRRVLHAQWSVATAVEPMAAVVQWGRLLRFDVSATSFCHQMVRSMVGMLVAVGQRRQTVADVHWMLKRADRSGAPDPAPPHGLSLVRVDYAP